MNTHKLLLSSVAAAALFATPIVAQTAIYDTEGNAALNEDGTALMADSEGMITDAEGVRLLDADGQPRMAETEGFVMEGTTSTVAGAMGGQIVVEQGDADVEVTVADPVVTVDQAQPEVLVEQAQPEITVTVAEPTVTVEQQAPIITIEQAQPEVVVVIPEPTITVRMPEPDVNVATAQPEISVQQPQPIVRFVRPEPRITIQESEPNVQVTQAEPQINVNRAESAAVSVAQADAEVTIESEGEGNVQLTQADPVVNIEEADDAQILVDQAEANVTLEEQGDANIVVTDQAAMAETDTILLADSEAAAGLYGAFADYRVSDLVGMNVLGETGNDVGEVDRLITNGTELMAIVGVGGFLGLGEHDVAIPLDRFVIGDDAIVLNALTEAELEAMPEWDETGNVLPLGMTVGETY
ncbi:PRC-barrel domain-containing protein [uncultured Jannaschia sp.]|uniref:PRC-barrel domain-containing protein n=1 Tax=uncultured Jannaschia sp. TaxID=293347 RepID=UPI0026304508|nr:PRC-barrel domain-containing protein [uncultured Jannaschia sp.]